MIPPARRSIADSSEPISVDFEGNKQGDTVKSDLGAAIQGSHSQVDIEVLVDANKMHEDPIVNLNTRKQVEMRARRNTAEKEQAANDYYASVRTNVGLTVCCARWSRNYGIQVSDPACLDFDKRKPGYSPSDRFLTHVHESIAHLRCEHLG